MITDSLSYHDQLSSYRVASYGYTTHKSEFYYVE